MRNPVHAEVKQWEPLIVSTVRAYAWASEWPELEQRARTHLLRRLTENSRLIDAARNPVSFIRTLVRNQVLEHIREQQRDRNRCVDIDFPDTEHAYAYDPYPKLDEWCVASLVMAQLRDCEREVLLACASCASHEEAAASLGVLTPTYKSRLYRARVAARAIANSQPLTANAGGSSA